MIIRRSAPGNDVPLSNGTRGSMISGPALVRPTYAILFSPRATGFIRGYTAAGELRTINVDDRAKGVWHLESFVQFVFLGTTVLTSDVELGWDQ